MGDFQGIFNNVWGLLLVVVFFGGSIFVHELGHFLAARKRGLKVERFSIGFGPRLFGWHRNGVDYRISLLPFGGYVALPQLADLGPIEGEYEDKAEDLPEVSYADKVIVFVMGAVFNLIFAFLLSLVLWHTGIPSSAKGQTNKIAYVQEQVMVDEETAVPGPAFEAGIQPGDYLLAIDNAPIRNREEYMTKLATSDGEGEDGERKATLTIKRDGKAHYFTVKPVLSIANLQSRERFRNIGIILGSVFVTSIINNSPGDLAGLELGDEIIRVDDVAVHNLSQIIQYLKDKEGVEVSLTVLRHGGQKELKITPVRKRTTKPVLTIIVEGKKLLRLVPMQRNGLQEDLGKPESEAALWLWEAEGLGEDIQIGESLWDLNGKSINSLSEALEVLRNHEGEHQLSFSSGRQVRFPAGAEIIFQSAGEQNLVGFTDGDAPFILYQDPVEQFKRNVRMTVRILAALLNPKSDVSIKHLSSPVGIGRRMHQLAQMDLRKVLAFVVFLNINLAILNLLPIPVLDGGHILFATIAKLRGKQLPARFILSLQGTFMVGFLCIMLYVAFYDSLRWIGDNKQEERLLTKVQHDAMIELPVYFEAPPGAKAPTEPPAKPAP